MPLSSPFIKKPVINFLLEKIKSENLKEVEILDLGIGYGDFGKLIRKNIPIKAKLTGVEIWKDYKNKKWDCYDEIILDDIRNYVKRSKKKFDIILFMDVLEHFDRKDGISVIKRLIEMVKKLLIVSTPVTWHPQGTYRGNPYEEHKHIWSEKELQNFGFRKIFSRWLPALTFYKTFWPLVSKTEVYVLEK